MPHPPRSRPSAPSPEQEGRNIYLGKLVLQHGREIEVFRSAVIIKSPSLRVESHFPLTARERGCLATLLKSPSESGAPSFSDDFNQEPELSSQDWLRQYADVIDEVDARGVAVEDGGNAEEDRDGARTMNRIADYIDSLERQLLQAKSVAVSM